MKAPRFAIVGTGRMAATMIKTFAEEGVSVKAVVSRTPGRANEFARSYGIADGNSDLKSILQRTDIDALYVANAPTEHAATVIAALRAGKAVLCEKPMATTEAELAEIVRAAEETGVLCMEALWTLCLPAYRHFLAFANSGDWGEPRSLSASFSYPIAEDNRRSDATVRSGVLLDRGIYLVALALSVFGSVKTISSQISFNSSGIDNEAFLQLTHHSGAHSQLSASFTSLMPNKATLNCSHGLIEIEAPLIGSERVSTLSIEQSDASSETAVSPSLTTRLKQRLGQNPRIRRLKRALDRPTNHHFSYGYSGYLPQLRHFIGLLEVGKIQSEIVSRALSLEVMEIIDEARRLANG